MTIQWFGQSFFKITTKNQKGEDVVIAIDPYDKSYGLKPPTKFGADLLLMTHDHKDHSNTEAVKGTALSDKPFEISGPGEYEVKGVMIYGIPSFHDDKEDKERGENTMFMLEAEGIWVAHLGDLGQKTVENGQLEQLQGADILMIPVGGVTTIDSKKASTIVSQIEPRVIIPMHYQIPGLKVKLDGVDKFITEEGIKPEDVQDKYKIIKKNLPQENTELVILKP